MVTPDRCLQSITARPEPNLVATGEPSIDVERGFADPVFAADVSHSGAAFRLPHCPQDLLFRMSLLRHLRVLLVLAPEDHACRFKLNLSLARFSGFGSYPAKMSLSMEILSTPRSPARRRSLNVSCAARSVTTLRKRGCLQPLCIRIRHFDIDARARTGKGFVKTRYSS
jgi:hypothetical protein